MNGLRWILLVIGLLILGGIYYFGTVGSRSRPSGREPPRREPELDGEMERELQRLGALINEDRRGVETEHEQAEPAALASAPEKIVSLYLRARGSGLLGGREIASAAEKAGLSFGRGNIFHRLKERGEGHVAIFSLANITNPGSFDPHRLDELQTPGLCLFMTLPNALGALDAWDAMLAAGQRLADLLDIDLLDETQSSLSRQRIAHIREQMRDFDRRHEVHVPGRPFAG